MRALLGTIIVLLLLLVGADIGGRLFAQSRAESALRDHYPAAADPQVSIHGFSFLLQAVQGSYSDITMSSNNVTLGPLTGVRVQVDLRDAHLPLSDAISGDISALTARRADFRASIPAESLGSALDQSNLTLDPDSSGHLLIGTTVTVAGQTIPVTISATASIADGSLTLAATVINAAGITLPAQVTKALQAKLAVKLPLTALPFPIDHAEVSAQDGALVVTASAVDVSAAQLGLTGSGTDRSGGSPTTKSTPATTTTPDHDVPRGAAGRWLGQLWLGQLWLGQRWPASGGSMAGRAVCRPGPVSRCRRRPGLRWRGGDLLRRTADRGGDGVRGLRRIWRLPVAPPGQVTKSSERPRPFEHRPRRQRILRAV